MNKVKIVIDNRESNTITNLYNNKMHNKEINENKLTKFVSP